MHCPCFGCLLPAAIAARGMPPWQRPVWCADHPFHPEQSLGADPGFLRYTSYSSWPYTFCWHFASWLFSPLSGLVTRSSLTEQAIAQPSGCAWPCKITRLFCYNPYKRGKGMALKSRSLVFVVFFFFLRTSNLLDQTDLAQGIVPRKRIVLALTSNCTLSSNGPWVQMDRNCSGWVFSWPDASRLLARSRWAAWARRCGLEPSAHKSGVGVDSPLSIRGALGVEGCQHLDGARLLGKPAC